MTPQYFGKYKAVVTNVYDEKEERGRIKVKCPSVLGEDESNWCETCFSFAYDLGGDFHLPLKGETVWVEFEEGDPNKPIWVGNWHSQFKTPIEKARDKTPDPTAPPLKDYEEHHDKTRIIQFEKGWVVIHRDYLRVYLEDAADTEFFTDYEQCYLQREKGTMKFYSNDDETWLRHTSGDMELYTNDDKTYLHRKDSELIMVDSDTQLFKADNNLKMTPEETILNTPVNVIVNTQNATINAEKTINLLSEGTIDIIAVGEVTIKGSNVNIN